MTPTLDTVNPSSTRVRAVQRLTGSRRNMLSAILELDQATPTELGEKTGTQGGSLYPVLDDLVDSGLARRMAPTIGEDSMGRRIVIEKVTLTAAGKRLARAIEDYASIPPNERTERFNWKKYMPEKADD